jgi:hypothetical protein
MADNAFDFPRLLAMKSMIKEIPVFILTKHRDNLSKDLNHCGTKKKIQRRTNKAT